MSQDVQTAENERKQTPLFYCLFGFDFFWGNSYGGNGNNLWQGWLTLYRKARSVYSTAQYFDVKQDHWKLQEMLLHSKGARKVPVIVEGEKVSIGYGGS